RHTRFSRDWSSDVCSSDLFVNGTVSGASNITVCGPAGSAVPSGYGCSTTWDPTQGMLGLVVVNPTNAATAFNRNGNGELDLTLRSEERRVGKEGREPWWAD